MALKVNAEFAKKFVAEKLLNELLKYLEKDPEKNVLNILKLLHKIAREENHKAYINYLIESYEKYPAVKEQFRRFFAETNPQILSKLAYNTIINGVLFGIPRQKEYQAQTGIHVPFTMLVDPTSRCNLGCTGCWAGKYQKGPELSFERLDQLFTEAKELGIYFIVLSGGEPLMYERLFELFEKHSDMAFMAYTNGTLIDEAMADKIAKVGNFSPAISIEGFSERTDARRGKGVFAKITRAMDLLRDRGVYFGASVTVTRENYLELTSDEFIDFLVEKGVKYIWSFHYVPVGKNPDTSLMLTPEERLYLAQRIPVLRITKPIIIADFWNDGHITHGCIAGGRSYFHINAKGEVEPCAFVHFAVDNINEKSLKEVLKNPLFTAYQKRQPFTENYFAPCPIIDVPKALRDIVAESNAYPTHEGADEVLMGATAQFLDKRALEWERVSRALNEYKKERIAKMKM